MLAKLAEPAADRLDPGSTIRDGAPGEVRTPNPRFRRPMLYPVELRARRGGPSMKRRRGESFWRDCPGSTRRRQSERPHPEPQLADATRHFPCLLVVFMLCSIDEIVFEPRRHGGRARPRLDARGNASGPARPLSIRKTVEFEHFGATTARPGSEMAPQPFEKSQSRLENGRHPGDGGLFHRQERSNSSGSARSDAIGS